MSQSGEQPEKAAWKERGGRLVRGAIIVGALAVGAAIIF